jgi:hypothetical protein
MAEYQLPLRSDLARFDFVLSLDGVAYKFFFSWSTREACWHMSLFLEDETPIWSGIRVVVNWPLNQRSRSALRPPGMFMAFDAEQQSVDPGLTDLGGRVQIIYFDAASVASIKAQLGGANA